MSRIPVSLIVSASGSADDLHACLDSLRPSVGLRDEVVCLISPDQADLRAELRGLRWVSVLEAGDAGVAERWARGLAATTHPVVVLLDGDVVLGAHWLDPVIETFGDADVVTAGPRCHLSYGPQGTAVPAAALVTAAAFKAFARRWRQEHRGQFTDTDRLGPVCVAVRRDALARAGGPGSGPGGELPYAELRAQGRIVIADGSLIAHVGSELCAARPQRSAERRPLVSASLIVKDEEDVLPSCLSALRDFADEVVVYDTGSTDRSVEIAREHGAHVIEGYWNDHFGDARNRSLAHCTGDWVLWVDADEVVVAGDPAAVRARLSTATEAAFLVGQENWDGHDGTGGVNTVLYPRLFRRDRARIYGRLHEQVVDRVTGAHLAGPHLTELTLVHSGYTVLRGTVKAKSARNLRLAELAAGDTGGLEALGNLARSQLSMGQVDASIETCREGLASASGRGRVTFLKTLIAANLAARRMDDANEVLEELRASSRFAVTVDEHEAQVRFIEGDYERALEIVQAFPEKATNDLLFVVGRDRLASVEITSLAKLERHDEAAARLRECLQDGQLPLSLGDMARVFRAAGGGLAEVAALVPHSSLRGLLFSSSEAPVDVADEVLEALWDRYPGEATVLALAARVGSRTPLLRAMEWAARLRTHGFTAACTLLALSADAGRAPRERVLAAAIALEMFADPAALPLLDNALDTVPDDEAAPVLEEMRLLAPGIATSIEFTTAESR